MRMLQGFSVGGEYTGVLVMLLEQAPINRRGRITSIGTFVSGTGVLLSSFTMLLLTTLFRNQTILAWGWRLPFALGFIMTIIILLLQIFMQESPYFEKAKQEKKIAKIPLWSAIRQYPRQIMMVMLLAGFLGIAYYMVTAFLPTYLIRIIHYPYYKAMLVTTLTAAVYAFSAPFCGHLTDLVGRKPVLLAGIGGIAILGYPMFVFLARGSTPEIYIAEMVLILLISASTAAFVTTINELFPTQERFSGMSTGYNIGNAIFGGTVPLVSTYLVHYTGNNIAPGWYLIITAIITLFLVKRFLPETCGRDI